MRTLHSILFAVLVSAAACTGSAQVHTTADVDYVQPPLVEVEPGVQVVADYDQPVFFNGGAYWRNDGGVWYRSRYHDRAWVRVDAAPVAVMHVQHPEMYVHYHGKVQVDEHHEARDEHHEMKDQNEVRHDEHEQAHDNAEVAHDRAEVRHDEVKGNAHEESHDAKELRHDEKDEAHDAKVTNKDEHKEVKDQRKVDKDEHKREKDERKH